MQDLRKFSLLKYPIFASLVSYHWIEVNNPFLSHVLQLIPRINNSHIALLLAWLILPPQLKNVIIPKKNYLFVIPLLLIITIKVPFVDIRPMNTVIAVISEWIIYILYFPLYIKLLSTPSGRNNFFLCSAISSIIACIIFLIYLAGIQPIQDFLISSNSMAVISCLSVPISCRGVFSTSGIQKYIYMTSFVLTFFVVLFAGSRSLLIISTIQLIFIALYVISFKRIILQGSIMFLLGFLFFSIINVDQSQLEFRNDKFNRILDWTEDGSVWLRIALYAKATDIFFNNLLLGAGWGAQTLSGIDGGEVDFENFRSINTSTKGLHSTYLRILSGTGLLGSIAFLYFFIKNLKELFKIKFSLVRKNTEFFVLLSISSGLILCSFQNTFGLYPFFLISSFILSTNVFVQNSLKLYYVYLKKSSLKI